MPQRKTWKEKRVQTCFHMKRKNKGWTYVIGVDKDFVKPQVTINDTGKQKSSNSYPNIETNQHKSYLLNIFQ